MLRPSGTSGPMRPGRRGLAGQAGQADPHPLDAAGPGAENVTTAKIFTSPRTRKTVNQSTPLHSITPCPTQPPECYTRIMEQHSPVAQAPTLSVPDWLNPSSSPATPTPPLDLSQRRTLTRALQDTMFEAMFERVLGEMVKGRTLKDVLNHD